MLYREIMRLRNACVYSWQGVKASWNDAGAFKLEVCLTPFIIAAAIYNTDDKLNLCIMSASWLLILLTELVNTAIEAVTDLACNKEIHPLAKKAKDCGSAAVTFAVIIFVTCWLIILF